MFYATKVNDVIAGVTATIEGDVLVLTWRFIPDYWQKSYTTRLTLADVQAAGGYAGALLALLDTSPRWWDVRETMNKGRCNLGDFAIRQQGNVLAYVVVPSASITRLDQCDIVIFTGTGELSAPFPFTHCTRTQPAQRLTVTGPEAVAPNDIAEFTVTSLARDGTPQSLPVDVYLDASGGYLPQRLVTLTETGKVRWRADLLERGESVKITVGFRNYPGIAEHLIKVV